MLSYGYMGTEQVIFHTAIIGGGAGGLFCAGSFDARKIVLEQGEKPARKLSVSGGGKCNFSNRFLSANDYLSQTPHFCKSALAAFGPKDFLRLLEENKIPYEERAEGQWFAFSAPDMVRFLTARARKANSVIQTGTYVQDVSRKDGLFTLHTTRGTVRAQHVVLATGGLSFPELGGNNTAAKIARAFGLDVMMQKPALCGLVFPKELQERFRGLAGNSLRAGVKAGKAYFTGDLLFTHEGISGPAVLNASLYWQEGQAVTVDFLPEKDALELLYAQKNTARTFGSALKEILSPKITKAILSLLPDSLADAPKAVLQQAARNLNAFTFVPARTAGYTKAEVTAGGIACAQIDPRTMESKAVKGLYIIGEALDVTGRLGGFNLQWAWSSAMAAARKLHISF